MQTLFLVAGIGYAFGGLLFGIALFRAGVLARWASVLLAYGTTSALALSVLPESFNRPFAVPTGVALIGLGVSLWRETVPRAGDGVGRGAGGPMSTRKRSWPVPVALVALSAIPLTAGTLRLIQLAGGPAVIPADHRFAGFPLALVVHIVGATTFALAGSCSSCRGSAAGTWSGTVVPAGWWPSPGCSWRSRRSG